MTAVLMLTVGAAFATPECKPLVGHFEAQVVPPGQGHCPATAPFCTAGRVWGGIQGSYQFVMSAARCRASPMPKWTPISSPTDA